MRQVDEERFSALVAWATAHGGTLHPALEVYKDDITGFSIRVKPDAETGLQPGDEIFTCPLTISLSYLNCLPNSPFLPAKGKAATTLGPAAGGHAAFPPEFMTSLPPHVISRFFLMQQYLLGKDSFWYPYIATLPQPDSPLSGLHLPPFWPEEDKLLLEGTNTGVAAQEIHDAVKDEFKRARKILKNASSSSSSGTEWDGDYKEYTNSLHTWAYSIFVSRSFRPTLVAPPDVWESAVANNPDFLATTAAGVQFDDFSLLLPVLDIANHAPHAHVRWTPSCTTLPPSTSTPEDAPIFNPCCHFVLLDDTYAAGQQIFLSYGSTKTNSQLLLSYGFIIPEGEALHNDYIHLRKKAPPSHTLNTHTRTEEPLTGPKEQQQQTEFLVSLRPMNHLSSLAGSRRQLVASDPGFPIRPEFAHVEDGLIWDICLMVIGGIEKKPAFIQPILSFSPSAMDPSISGQTTNDIQALRLLLLCPDASHPLPPETAQILSHVQQILLAKLGQEYDKICETDPDKEEFSPPQTNNQKLALAYRSQAKKVLENAIAALVPDWQPVDDDDEQQE